MKGFKYEINTLITLYLGALFRKTKSILWLRTLISPLTQLYVNYDKWRIRQAYLIQLTAQIKSIQGYLNDSFDSSLRRIRIISIPEGVDGWYVSVINEKHPFLITPIKSEGEAFVEAPYIGSLADTTVVYNFIVSVPMEYQKYENQIIALIKQVKLAGKQFVVRYV